MHKKIALFMCLMLAAVSLSGCGETKKTKLTIAEQFGIAYAPVQVMKDEGILEKALPDMEIEWVQLGGPTAIREGMLSGSIDIGFMGIGPMLLGVDTGMEWKCFSALSANEVSFITNREDIQSLADIQPDDRIAILSPGCTQHILLCMAAEQQFGDPDKFDEQLVSLSHPDAMSAMLAGGEIVLHITTPPYADLELENGMHKILTGQQIMGGPFTFICGVADTALYNEHKGAYDAFQQSLSQAIDEINTDLPAAAEKLAPVYGVDEELLLAEMSYGGSIYGKTLSGVEKLASAMVDMGLLSKAPSAEEYAFPDVEVAQ
ncbi:MAG: ABC transporter substrate-binding protein [Eubacteriales bacterium]|nr:ABC transporter substrate-binding protein [Eubacteriales bacterium]